MKLLFLDCETTGTDSTKHAVVQIAGIIEIDGEIRETFNLTCRPMPGQVYSSEALTVIGKTVDELKAYPDPKETYKQLVKIFDKYINRYDKTDKFYMVGQNTKFDYDFMTQWFKNNGNPYYYAYVAYHLIDLIQATALFTVAGKLALKNMKLATVAEHFGIQFDAHDAMADITTTRKLFYHFIELIKQVDMLCLTK